MLLIYVYGSVRLDGVAIALALDPERVRTFATWREQQRDWSSHTASFDLTELSSDVRDEIERFYASPNVWEPGARGAVNPPRHRFGQAESS